VRSKAQVKEKGPIRRGGEEVNNPQSRFFRKREKSHRGARKWGERHRNGEMYTLRK